MLVHLAAWQYPFSATIEMWLWRISAVPLVSGLMGVIDHDYKRKKRQDGGVWW